MTRRWVVLETGANQDYIYDSDRMRHVVGGSQLVLDVGMTWAGDACAAVAGAELVQQVSGKAVLLVPDEATGRAVIRAVTRRSLTQAPGLEVTGAIGPPFDDNVPYRMGTSDADDPSGPPRDHVAALRRTFTEQGRARAARPSRHLRDPILPWHQPCRETGLPAAGLERFGAAAGNWHPAGAATLAKARARGASRTRERLHRLLGNHPKLLPQMVDDLTDDGWIAVVHADGNGVGSLLHDFPDRVGQAIGSEQVSLAQHVNWLGRFSRQLGTVTEEAFVAAVDAAVATTRSDHPDWSLEGRLLPILLGGDDVTFVCHAGLALPLVRAFLQEFAARSRRDDTIRDIAGPHGLSAAAGVAIVKRHHPFSAAYDLAEELTASAKTHTVRRLGQNARALHGEDGADGGTVSAYDVHVAHESTLRALRELREDLVVDATGAQPVARHGGPYVVSCDELDPLPGSLVHRDERRLLALLELLRSGVLSSARAHDLRGALDRGVSEYRARLDVALARSVREHDQRGEPVDWEPLQGLLDVVQHDEEPRPFVRLPDALLLHGVLPRSHDRTSQDATRDQASDLEVAR